MTLYTSSSSAKVSSCDSAGVSGYDDVIVIDPFEVTVVGVEGVAMNCMASLAVIFIATLCATKGCTDRGLGVEATEHVIGTILGLDWDICCSFCCLTCMMSEWLSVNWITCAAWYGGSTC